jgi:excisionase family DNA binding protein
MDSTSRKDFPAMMSKRPSPAPARLLRLKPASEYLSISPAKIRALAKRGEIRVIRYEDNSPWLVDVRDLDAWIEQQKNKRRKDRKS